jgi:hypothetical protein
MAWQGKWGNHRCPHCGGIECDIHLDQSIPNQCEYSGCKKPGIQADNYLNAWLCTNHFSLIGRLTDDYQAPVIDWDALEVLTA